MADIDVVPKSKTNVWLWIIAAIVIALIVWAVMARMSGNTASRVGGLLNHLPAYAYSGSATSTAV